MLETHAAHERIGNIAPNRWIANHGDLERCGPHLTAPSGSRGSPIAAGIGVNFPEKAMPRGDKDKYTDKQKRMAEHIEEGYEKKGVGHEEAERRAWATVNKDTGGGNKPGGSGRGVRDTDRSDRSHAERSRAAKKGWQTRRREGTD
jgi:hypothetical protein